MIVCRGKLERIPEGFVLARATRLWPMMTTRLLSPWGKVRFLLERWIPRSPSTTADRQSKTDESVADFVRHRMGREVLERLAGPLVAGIYTADIERLSLRATLGPIAAMVAEHGSLAAASRSSRATNKTDRSSAGARYQRFRGFPRGTWELIDGLERSLRSEKNVTIRLQTPVKSIRFAGGTWNVSTESEDQPFDEVVLAAPAHVSASLLRTVPDSGSGSAARAASKALGSIESSSAAIVVLAVPTNLIARLPSAFGVVVPAIEGRNLIAISFASHKYEGRCPDDHTIVRVFVGGALQRELLEHDDQSLIELVRAELSDLIGLAEGDPTLARVIRWSDSMPQYHVGHLTRVDQISTAMEQLTGLWLVTNALHGVGIAPVISAARQTADRISEQYAQEKTGDT